MTTSLTVLTKPTEQSGVFDVYWACGIRTQGVVSVTLACKPEGPDVVAELSALRYLLEDREVCGQDRTGNSMRIVCSLGAVKKLARGKSDKASLAPFALFLRTRFADAEIAVSKADDFISYPKAHNHRDSVTVDGPVPSRLMLPDGLQVGITQHALEAYMVRYQNLVAANAWRALRAAMAQPDTKLQHATADEDSLHGKTIRAYVTSGGMRLIVAMEAGEARLLTCYYSHSAAMAARGRERAIRADAAGSRCLATPPSPGQNLSI